MTEYPVQERPDPEIHARLAAERLVSLNHIQADFDTYRRLAEEERARLVTIVEDSDDSIVVETLDGIITSWNSGSERIYGYPAQEMIGRSISLLDPPEQPDDSALIIERVRNGEKVTRYETQHRKRDGGLINVILTASPIRDAQNHLTGISTIAHDITGSKRTEETLRDSEIRYRRLFEAAQDGILILDADTGQIVEVNPFLIEMQVSNEELTSTNEELQSTNEELETSKEELQSVNEEIVTVNSELQAKIEQLTEYQNDMKNLLENVNVGTIFLDVNLAIKRFNRDATKVFRFASSDTGRPLADIRSQIPDVDLISDANQVLDSLIPLEKNVRTEDNEWYLMRIIPYRTFDNVIDGVVMTFSNINNLKAVESEAHAALTYAQNIVDTVREPLVVLNGKFEVVSASRMFYQTFNMTREETEGTSLYALGDGQWDIPGLRKLIGTIISKDTFFDDFPIEHDFPGVGHKILLLNGRRIPDKEGVTHFILLAMEDITSKKSLEVAHKPGTRNKKRGA